MESRRARELCTLPGLWIAGFLAFIPLLGNKFIGDDFTALSIHKQFAGQPFFKTILYGGNDFLRPFNLTIIMIRGELFDGNPLPFVIANIVMHLVNTSLVFVLARKIFKKYLPALVSSVLFLVAFSHYEGITWISSSITLFVTCYMLVSILGFIKWRERGGAGWLVMCAAGFLMAFLTKETAISLPFIFLAYDLFLVRKEDRKKGWGWPYIAFGALTAIYLIVQTGFAAKFAGGETSVYYPGWHVLTNIADYWVWLWMPNPRHPYVAQVLSILPRPLLAAYWILAGGVALGLIAVAVLVILRKLERPMLWSIISTFLALAIFLPFAIKISARYAYLPSVFLSLFAGGGFALLWPRWKDRGKKALRIILGVAAGLYLMANITALIMVQREFVKVSTRTEELALQVGEVAELVDDDVVFIEGLASHVHLREAVQWYHNPTVKVYADNDAYRGTPKTVEEMRNFYEGNGVRLFYIKVEGDSLSLISQEIIQ